MKNFKSILTLGMLFVSTAGFAQFANNGSSHSSGGGSALIKDTESYSRIYIGYNPTTITSDIKGVDNTTLNGFTFGYTKGISLSKNLPIFLELGARFNFGFKSENLSEEDDDEDDDSYYSTRLSYDDDYYDEDEEETCKTTTASLVVPINVAYKLTFAGGDFSVSPFLGITLKGNILGKEKYEYGDEKETIDFFDKKDMEGKEYTWNRFQAGWQIGANLDYKALSLGFHYGSDFNEIAKKTNTKNWAINIGYKF